MLVFEYWKLFDSVSNKRFVNKTFTIGELALKTKMIEPTTAIDEYFTIKNPLVLDFGTDINYNEFTTVFLLKSVMIEILP